MIDKITEHQQLIKESATSTFCVLPWIHFATRPNGDMRLCCNANSSGAGSDHTIGLVKSEDGTPSNFSRTSPMSAWNNTYMRNVRRTMAKGEIPSSCTKCFNEEAKGVVSKRLWEAATWRDRGVDFRNLLENTSDDGSVPEKLLYLDLRLGHTCNIKCVMCSPHDSSQWVNDWKKLTPQLENTEIKRQMDWDKSSFNNKWHETESFWNDLYQQIPNLKEVYFAGGEPLMIREHKKFIEEIIRQNCHTNIILRYNTNGLLIDQDLIDLWKYFKKVKVGVSIDATEERNQYIRFPSNWETIEKNLHLLDNTPDNIRPSIATAVQIFNIKHLPNFVKWKVLQNFRKVNIDSVHGVQVGGGLINMHLLYIPTFLSIQILPKQDKQEIVELFNELKIWLYQHYTQDTDFWEINPYGWKRWLAILNYMNARDQSNLLAGFKEYINKLDQIRGVDAKSVFPELAHLL
jgi:MoaA/NifB/PqqE/SkfB family radical SAM enzyme